MRLIFTIIFFCAKMAVSQYHYYVKSSGNNGNLGLSDAAAWANISKINSFSFSDYDTISFQAGDTIFADEMLNITHAKLIFNSYGVGTKPVISGFSNLAMS